MPVAQISLENNLFQLCNMFLQDLTDPLSIIDCDYRNFWANRKRAGEHNLSQEEIIGEVCYEIFFGKNKPCSQEEKLGQVLNALEKERSREFELSRNDRFRYRTR